MREVIGYGILALVFGGIFALMVIDDGWKTALISVGSSIGIAGLIALAVFLIES